MQSIEEFDIVELLSQTAVCLWKDWPSTMEVSKFNLQQHQFTLKGVCPHCHHDSVFMMVTTAHVDSRNQWIAALQCQGCNHYVLAVASHISVNGLQSVHYDHHYPLGKPDDSVAEEIPPQIQPDFKEALRCLWVNAYNATAEMCRRAIEASCIDLGAPEKLRVLEDKIDWLEEKRKITPFLRDVAHKIRLGGNRAAHPPDSGPPQLAVAGAATVIAIAAVAADPEPEKVTVIEKEHAEAIVKFCREFFHHVYVVPKQLDKYDFSRPPKAATK